MSKKPFPMHPVSLYETDPVERKAVPGPFIPNTPSETKGGNNEEKSEVKSTESDIEKQLAIALKKANKDASVTHEGRINIITQVEGPKEALCVKYNEDFNYIAVGNNDGVIRVYHSSTGKDAFQLSDDDVKNKRSPVTAIKHKPVSKVYPVTNCFTGTCK